MCERARRSRDASSRYSIDTLFPGLSNNNSAHARNTTEESFVEEKDLAGPSQSSVGGAAVVEEENDTKNGLASSAEIGARMDEKIKGEEEEGGGGTFPTPAHSPTSSASSPPLATAITTPASTESSSLIEVGPSGTTSGRRKNQNNGNGSSHRGRKRANEGSDDRLVKEGKSSRHTTSSTESVDNNVGVCSSKLNSVGSSRASASTSSSTSPPSSSSTNGGSGNNGRIGNSKSSSGANPGRKRAGSPLKPTTIQPKQQMSLLSTSKMSRKTMFEAFQPWVLRTYGDSAKTKTITKKKYCRIVKTLRGEEINNAENSKFRFWVKAKGFHIGPPPGHPHVKDDIFPFANNNNNDGDGPFSCYMDPELYVPTTVKDGSTIEKSVYKKVAVVEYFFDIIYTVHVETEAKNGKHAGQKRTYRAITEKYAFLPREAVTKFLLQCMECQKRGSPGGGGGGGAGAIPSADSSGKVIGVESNLTATPDVNASLLLPSSLHPQEVGTNASLLSSGISAITTPSATTIPATNITSTPETSPLSLAISGGAQRGASSSCSSSSSSSSSYLNNNAWKSECNGKSTSPAPPSFDMNFSLPFTTTYLRQQEQQKHQDQLRLRNGFKQEPDDDQDTRLSDPNSEEDHEHRVVKGKYGNSKASKNESQVMDASSGTSSDLSSAQGGSEWLGYPPLGLKKEPPNGSNNNLYSNGKHDFREQSSPLSLSGNGGTVHEVVHDETSSNGNKEDEDDDDDESEDKMDTHQYDPERLKAFNMFVRLFVDENLDRMVPISKQPKEKIQAIIDSCTRQFPEFAERARKRIRTYLKSCRRNKRTRDSNGWESDLNLLHDNSPTSSTGANHPMSTNKSSGGKSLGRSKTKKADDDRGIQKKDKVDKKEEPTPAPAVQDLRTKTNKGRPRKSRPTPAHLTSVQAEQILAQACENESQNAKRMRMGLEPVSQPLPMPLNENKSSKENGSGSARDSSTPEKSSKSSPPAPPAAHSLSSAVQTIAAVAANTTSIGSPSPGGLSSDGLNNQNLNLSVNGSTSSTPNLDGILGQLPSAVNAANKSLERSPLVDYSRTMNGNGVSGMSMYRPNFGQSFPRSAPFPSLFPSASAAAVAAAAAAVGGTSSFPHNVSPLPVTNGDAGPTDLSMKSKPLLTHKLNATELATVRQLITGYRESAAFLLRSADELEQLLIQQQ